MRVALVSYEFPPLTAYGGIASYMHETALMLSHAGHDVEVFCAGPTQQQNLLENKIPVHVVADMDKDRFAESLLPIFTKRHDSRSFDVVECAEIYGDGRAVRREFPRLPLVVKLHTPSFLCHRLCYVPLTFSQKLRFFLGSLMRGTPELLKEDFSVLEQRNKVEPALYHDADAVVSPSRDLIRLIEAEWGRRSDGIDVLPNPHSPSSTLLEMPASTPGSSVLYLGRLELRKGVSDLVEALALFERDGNPVPVRFVGAPYPSPRHNLLMDAWAASKLPMQSGRYVFTGQLSREAALKELAGCGLVILPSRWENFPYTCLEAMAAGRVVIGSSAGGMSDMITDGVDGLLIPPNNPRLLAAKIREVIDHPDRFVEMGAKARARVLSAYSPATILPQQIATYEKAIRANQRRHGPA